MVWPSPFNLYGLYPPLKFPQYSIWFVPNPSAARYFTPQPGKGLTSCTTMCSLTTASAWLVSLATRLVPTNQKTPIMTVSGRLIVTGLPHFLVRYRLHKQKTGGTASFPLYHRNPSLCVCRRLSPSSYTCSNILLITDYLHTFLFSFIKWKPPISSVFWPTVRYFLFSNSKRKTENLNFCQLKWSWSIPELASIYINYKRWSCIQSNQLWKCLNVQFGSANWHNLSETLKSTISDLVVMISDSRAHNRNPNPSVHHRCSLILCLLTGSIPSVYKPGVKTSFVVII